LAVATGTSAVIATEVPYPPRFSLAAIRGNASVRGHASRDQGEPPAALIVMPERLVGGHRRSFRIGAPGTALALPATRPALPVNPTYLEETSILLRRWLQAASFILNQS
jgi:hypothetical protein